MAMLRSYLRALWRHWSKLLTGGSLMAVLAVWGITGNALWPMVGIGVVGLTFLMASYEAWKEEYSGTDLKARTNRVAAFKRQALILSTQGFPADWAKQVDDWADETRAFLETCSERALVVFDDTTGRKASHYTGVPTELQDQYWLLSRRIKNISIIADKPDVYLS
jgi:hypothetical protein